MGTDRKRDKAGDLVNWLLGAVLLFGGAGQAPAYTLEIGSVSVQPGGMVYLPVSLGDAANVATIQFQVNYNPQPLTLVHVFSRDWALGNQFSLEYSDDEGTVSVILYRETGVPSGSGELAVLQFKTNEGVPMDYTSSFVLAQVGIGDEGGKDLLQEELPRLQTGTVHIEPAEIVDSDGNGLPDMWEAEHTVFHVNPNTISANGINTVREAYIAGLDPNDPKAALLSSIHPDRTLRWSGVSGRVYSVYWTANLLDGFTHCLERNIPWTRAAFTNSTETPSGYYKIEVELAP